MATCECHVAAAFPYLGGLGIVSATLRTNASVNVTTEGLILQGPTYGDFSITGYAPLGSESLPCPGKAGVSFQWDQRIECDTSGFLKTYFIPRGGGKAYTEGSVTNDISMVSISNYENFSASAASGPHTVYLLSEHQDGYDFYYNGSPISISPDDGYHDKSVSIFSGILPANSELYLTNFSWSYEPPNVPSVSYSFIFSFND